VSRKRWIAPVALVLAFATAAAVGSAASAERAAPHASIKMAIVTDIGGLNDKGFNQSANAGRIEAQKKLKIPTKVFVTQTANDRLPNLLLAAKQGYNLVFGIGFFMGDPLDKVAPQFPNTKFAGVDVDYATDIPSKAKNVRGLQFREQEAGYLVGYIAGLVTKYTPKKPQVVSGIGANPVPAIVRYLAGYKAGAKKANPNVTVINSYANDLTFNDQAKCKEVALNQLQRKTQVIFTAAGGCGLGGLSAANKAGKWGIGVDVNQGYLHPKTMLTSALKEVQNAVFLTTKQFKNNPSKFKGGFNVNFTLKNGGVGYAPINKRAPKHALITKKVNAIKKLIIQGKIKVPAK
jgi:basic membrane protein A and related proteins